MVRVLGLDVIAMGDYQDPIVLIQDETSKTQWHTPNPDSIREAIAARIKPQYETFFLVVVSSSLLLKSRRRSKQLEKKLQLEAKKELKNKVEPEIYFGDGVY